MREIAMNPGTLYIMASPIGNMEDITLRALRIMKEEVDLVYCEDTRQTRKLLNTYGIKVPVRSFHAHSSKNALTGAVKELTEGRSIAYLTDSGTPSISDPGSLLVSTARERNIPVIPLPGASALTALISVSGFPEKKVVFTGFLSKKEGKKRRELLKLGALEGIIVIYESPYRIRKTLRTIYEVFPDSDMVIGREMTKIHEEFIAGSAQEIFEKHETIVEKGEFAIALYNNPKKSGKNGKSSRYE